jgi:hypothetical protein
VEEKLNKTDSRKYSHREKKPEKSQEKFPEILIKALAACRTDRFMKVNKKNI